MKFWQQFSALIFQIGCFRRSAHFGDSSPCGFRLNLPGCGMEGLLRGKWSGSFRSFAVCYSAAHCSYFAVIHLQLISLAAHPARRVHLTNGIHRVAVNRHHNRTAIAVESDCYGRSCSCGYFFLVVFQGIIAMIQI